MNHFEFHLFTNRFQIWFDLQGNLGYWNCQSQEIITLHILTPNIK